MRSVSVVSKRNLESVMLQCTHSCHESHHILYSASLQPREGTKLPCCCERNRTGTGWIGEDEQAVDLHVGMCAA